jgi:phage baseplate assembly protein W
MAHGVVQAHAEKNKEENAPACAEALVSEEDAIKEARLGSILRGRSGRRFNGRSGGCGLRELLVVQGISSSFGLVMVPESTGPIVVATGCL